MARYWVGGTGTWDASNTANWSDISGGAGGFSVPTASDDVFFDGNSGGGTVTVTASALGLSINFTGFAGTFAGSSGITISGNVTLGAGTTYTYTGTLTINATATLTANGKTWTGSLTTNTGANTTFTLADAWIIDGSFTFGNSAVTHTFNGFTLSIKTNLTISGSSIASGSDGTTEFIMIGTGNIVHSGSSFSRKLQNPFRINTAGTITFDTHTITFAGDFVYVAGTVVTTGSLVHFNNGSGSAKTLTTNGITFNNVTFGNTSTSTYTLSNVMDITGTLVFGTSNSNTYTLNGSSISAKGNITITITNGTIAGTTVLNINGTGSQTWSGTSSTPIRLDTNINKSSGTLTLGTNIAYNTGTLTYTAGTVITTGSTLTIAASVTLDTAGITWNNITFSNLATATITLNSDLTLNGTLLFNCGNSTTTTFNGNTINAKGNISTFFNSPIIIGTSVLNINGTGSQTWNYSNLGIQVVGLDTIINSSGTLNIGNIGFGNNKTLTYSSGTVNCTGLLTLINATIDTGIINWNNVIITGTITVTLLSNLIVAGDLTIGSGGLQTTINDANIYVAGSLSVGGTTSVVQGTANIIFNGTGTWSSTQSSSGNFRLNVTFNTAGIITVSGNIQYRTGTITYTAGTIITTGSTLNLRANATVNTNGMTWDNVTMNFAAMTLTINSLLSMSGTLTLGSFDIVIDGTSGFTCGTLSMTTALTAARSLTLAVGKTYTINTQFTITGATNAFRYTIKSGTPGTKAILTLSYGANQNVGYTNATDIDSNAGQTVYSFNGVITTTFNWSTLTYPRNYGFTFQH